MSMQSLEDINREARDKRRVLRTMTEPQRSEATCITCGVKYAGSWTGECPPCEQKAIAKFVSEPQHSEQPTCKCVEQGYPEQDCKWHGEAAQRSEQQEWTHVVVNSKSATSMRHNGKHIFWIESSREAELATKAINAALAAELQRREKAEKERDKWRKDFANIIEDRRQIRQQLLSAQAATEKHDGYAADKCHYHVGKTVDLSALREHDAKVRLPLSIALKQIADGLKGSSGFCQDCDSARDVAENALLWTSGSDAIEKHDAEVRKPLVEALEDCESALAAFLPQHPAGPKARAMLSKSEEAA